MVPLCFGLIVGAYSRHTTSWGGITTRVGRPREEDATGVGERDGACLVCGVLGADFREWGSKAAVLWAPQRCLWVCGEREQKRNMKTRSEKVSNCSNTDTPRALDARRPLYLVAPAAPTAGAVSATCMHDSRDTPQCTPRLIRDLVLMFLDHKNHF